MNPQIPDELVSAYFDGEVTPEERAAVERLLAESHDAQRELNETARLSALLHSFPRESAPVDLVGNVLQQTNQMALRPQAPVATPLARREMRAWKAALISTLISTFSTAAACVLIVRNFSDHQAGAPLADNRLKPLAAPLPASRPQESPMLSDVAMLEKFDDLERGEQRFSKREAGEALRFKDESLSRVAPAPSSGAAVVAAAAGRADAVRGQAVPLKAAGDAQLGTMTAKAMQSPLAQFDSNGAYGNLGLSNGVVLEGLPEGKVYFLQVADPDNSVAVVELTVVDMDKGVDTCQFLLTKRSIHPRSVNEKKGAQSKIRRAEGADTDLVAIYVVAPGEVLAQVLKDVELHPDLVLGWSSQPPLQLQLASNEEAKSQVRKKTAESTPAQAADKKSDADQPNLSADETVADMAEANQVVQALMDRNNSYSNPPNSVAQRQSESKEPGTEGRRNLPVAAKKDSDGTLEKAKTDRGAGVAAAATEQAAGNYYPPMRVNNSALEVTNPGAYSRALQTNPTNLGGAGQVALAAQATGKPQRDVSSPVRMLLVLHQAQAEGAQDAPAPPVTPAGKPGRQ